MFRPTSIRGYSGMISVVYSYMTVLLGSYYEGHSMDRATFPVRVFKLLGVETMIGKRESQRYLVMISLN